MALCKTRMTGPEYKNFYVSTGYKLLVQEFEALSQDVDASLADYELLKLSCEQFFRRTVDYDNDLHEDLKEKYSQCYDLYDRVCETIRQIDLQVLEVETTDTLISSKLTLYKSSLVINSTAQQTFQQFNFFEEPTKENIDELKKWFVNQCKSDKSEAGQAAAIGCVCEVILNIESDGCDWDDVDLSSLFTLSQQITQQYQNIYESVDNRDLHISLSLTNHKILELMLKKYNHLLILKKLLLKQKNGFLL